MNARACIPAACVPRPTRLASAAALLSAFATIAAAQSPALQRYDTKYYVLHTDLDADGVREAGLRMTLMAEEYYRRTRGLAGTIDRRLPFYLFKNREDYYAAGGAPGSAGVFTGDKLMAAVMPAQPQATWHTVQHEGFHQFVAAAVGPGIPIWANEGLAEYFGHGIFTGDHFLTGAIHPGRLQRVKASIEQGRFKSLRDMMLTHHEVWNVDLRTENYDQAWSMVYFLGHADDGRYQEPFMRFLHDVSRGLPWEEAWVRRFGRDVQAFEQRWREYWLAMPADPTADLMAQAVASTLTSFFARAFSQRQYFDNFEAFTAAAHAGQLKAHPNDWLPPSLLETALRLAPSVGQWRLERLPGEHALVCTTKAGTVLEGTFRVSTGRVKSVTVAPSRRFKAR